jgi:hypothetical protein
MPPKPKVQLVSLQLTPENYKRIAAAAKHSCQTVEEWIVSMCDMATRD